MKVGVAIVDVATALFAGNAFLAALFARERSGAGQHLEMALLDSQIVLLANVSSNYLCLSDVPGRWGNAHASIVPYQAFQAADDYLVLAIGNDGQLQRFCEVTGVSDWAAGARFASNPQLVAHREALIPMLEDLFRQKRVEEWLELCASADVPAGPVNTIDRVFADRQALSRGMLVEMERTETVRLAGSPLNLSETRVQMCLPPPLLGEHTDEILGPALKMDEKAIEELRRDGVV